MTSLIQVFSDPASPEIPEHFLSQVCWLAALCVPAQYTLHIQPLLTLVPAGDGGLGLFGEAVYLTKTTGQGGKHVGIVSWFYIYHSWCPISSVRLSLTYLKLPTLLIEKMLQTKLPDYSCRFKGVLQLLPLRVCGGPGSLKMEYRTEHCVRTGVYWLFQVPLLQSLSDVCSNLERCLGCLVISLNFSFGWKPCNLA